MKKLKRLFCYFIVLILIITSYSSYTAFTSDAATDDESVSTSYTYESEASLNSSTCTIIYDNGKYYYVNSNGKINKKKGWKTDAKGVNTYYVCGKGYVKFKIVSGRLYKWDDEGWLQVNIGTSKYKKMKKVGKKYYYVNSKGKINKKSGWKKNSSGEYSYYVCKKGYIQYNISSTGVLYEWKNSKWNKVTLTKSSEITIGGKTFYVNASGQISSEPEEDTDTDSESSSSNDELYSYAEEIVELVNKEREKEGYEALEINTELMKNAATRAKEIVTKFSHIRPDGSDCFTVVTKVDYYTLGENIAYTGTASTEHVMNLWMNSAGHKSNILNESFNAIGVGVYYYGGYYYWVQIFAGIN